MLLEFDSTLAVSDVKTIPVSKTRIEFEMADEQKERGQDRRQIDRTEKHDRGPAHNKEGTRPSREIAHDQKIQEATDWDRPPPPPRRPREK